MIEVKGYWIEDEGDRSVGIMDAIWKVEGTFCFDSAEERKAFEDKLHDLFLDQSNGIALRVTSFEDREAECAAEREFYKATEARGEEGYGGELVCNGCAKIVKPSAFAVLEAELAEGKQHVRDLLDKAGECDICIEDHCGVLECTCSCHKITDEIRERARRWLTWRRETAKSL